MSEVFQYIIFFVLIGLGLVFVYFLIKYSFSNNRTVYINNFEDLSTHYYRYLLYFWAVGIFIPFSELYIDLFSVRPQSEFVYNLLVGICCLSIAVLSNYFNRIRKNLHRLFLVFFIFYNLLLFHKIATNNELNYLTLTEFALVNMISYYVFYKLKYFYFYFGLCLAFLLCLVYFDSISSKEFILYFNCTFIAFSINFVVHHVDLNIKENLFFAYNYFNKGNQFIIGVNQEGFVTFASSNIEIFFGFKSRELIGKNWNLEVKFVFGFENNNSTNIINFKHIDGSTKIIEWQEEDYNEDLNIKIGRDISKIKFSENQLTNINNRLNNLISNIGDLVFVLDLNLVFTEYYQSENDKDLIVSPAFFLGKNIKEIGFPEDALSNIIVAIENTINTKNKSNTEYNLNFGTGLNWYNVMVSPLFDNLGEINEIICIARNTTLSKKSELDLKNTKELLELTSKVAKVGGWYYDLITQKIHSSRITKEIFEVYDNRDSGYDQIINYFEEGFSRNSIISAINKCISDGDSYDLELPIITAKGNRLWVRAKGDSEFVNGVCVKVFGFVQDIDSQVKVKNALAQSEQKFRYISENISDVVIFFEGNNVSYLSSKHQTYFGYTNEEATIIANKNIYDFFHPDDHVFLERIYREAIRNKEPKLSYVSRFLLKNGTYIWREDSVSLIYDENGRLSMRLITARDISKQKKEELLNESRREIILKQNEILISLSKNKLNSTNFWNEALPNIIESASEGINVGRVSIWIYKENRIECADLYLKKSKLHTTTEPIYEKDFPKYFEGLRNELAIIANDAETNIYTSGFSESYLIDTQVKSMLDVPIYVAGQLVGAICWENEYEIKNWTDEEVSFAKSIADYISIGIEAEKRVIAELELKKTKEILELTSFVAKVGGWEIDIENNKVFFSDINKSTLDAPFDFELNLENALNFFKIGKNRDLAYSAFNQCFKKGIPFDIEVEIISLTGQERWVRAIGQSEYINGRSKRLYGTFQDIDNQVKLIHLIKEKELQYRSLLSNLTSVTFRCLDDSDWTMIFISDAIEQLTGFPAEDFIDNNKRKYTDIVFEDDIPLLFSNSKGDLEEYSIEYRIVTKNKEILWVNEKGRSYFDENENKVMLDGIISNITDQKNTAIALKNSYEELILTQKQLLSIQVEQEKFVSLVKYSGALIGMSDMMGKIIFLNDKAKLTLGVTDELNNIRSKDFYSNSGKAQLDNIIYLHILNKGMWQGEQELYNLKTQERLITDATIFLIKDPNTKNPVAIATIQIDITEKKKAEAKLIEKQKELQYKSELFAAIAKSTEKLLISKNIDKTLSNIFELIGKVIDADRIYYFENNIDTNLLSQKVEWVQNGIRPQINNPILQNMSYDDYSFFTDELIQNKVIKKKTSEIENPEIVEFLKAQEIVSFIMFPILVKGKFYGTIGFDYCNNEQIWSEDKINIFLSLVTSVANAIERLNNEKIISESEANFRQINETLEDVFLLYDLEKNKYIYVSPSCKNVFEKEQEYFYESSTFLFDYIVKEDQKIKLEIINQIKSKNTSEVEYRIITTEGHIRWIYQKSVGIVNSKGKIIRVSAICSDITDQKNIQSEVKQLSLVAEKISNGVLIADNEGKVIWANQSFLDMMEIDLNNLIGNRPSELFNPTFKDQETQDKIVNGNNFKIEVEIETFKKSKKWIEIVNTAIKDEKGVFIQQIEVVIDITERKKVESLLVESEERYRFIAENTSDGIFVIENSIIVYTSPSYQKMFGYTFEETYYQSLKGLEAYIHIDDVENYRTKLEYFTSQKAENFSLQYRNLHKKGHYIWREDTITAFYQNDTIFRLICVVKDITVRKSVENELVEERKLLRAIIDNIPVNVYVKNTSSKKILSNRTDVLYSGFKDEKSVLGKTDFELFNNISAQKSFEQDVKVIQSKKPIIGLETQLIKNNGEESWLLVSKIPLINEKQDITGLVGVSVDITEQRRSRQLIQDSERTLSSILNSLDEVVWAVNLPEVKLVLINNSFERVLGINSKAWKRNFNLWKDVVLTEDIDVAQKMEKDVFSNGVAYGLFRIKDRFNKVKWLENAVKLIKNDFDEPVMIIGTSTDITDKKNAEEALIYAQEIAENANKSKAELELRALQMQMNPHFVFNALNSIQSYILNQDTLTANLYLSKFSRLIRLFLDSSRSKFIPLFEEINLLTLYIELEKIRFENKFEFQFIIDSNVNKNLEIPTMILQPFIENAINHGLRYKHQKGLLSIRFYKENEYLICIIEDDGVGRRNSEKIQDKSSKGYKSQGLKITTERLITYNKINDANIVFSIKDKIDDPENPNDEVGTLIEIRFPEV